jgi:hypothetical protein
VRQGQPRTAKAHQLTYLFTTQKNTLAYLTRSPITKPRAPSLSSPLFDRRHPDPAATLSLPQPPDPTATLSLPPSLSRRRWTTAGVAHGGAWSNGRIPPTAAAISLPPVPSATYLTISTEHAPPRRPPPLHTPHNALLHGVRRQRSKLLDAARILPPRRGVPSPTVCSTASLSDGISSRGGVQIRRASLSPPPPVVRQRGSGGRLPLSPLLAREDHALPASTLAEVVGACQVQWRTAPMW